MKKLLLAVLTWMVLADASRAEGLAQLAAGTFGTVPVGAQEAGPGMVTLVVEKARTAAYRLAGRVLASLIVDGMSQEQVLRILGKHDCARARLIYYRNLKIAVCFDDILNATGDRCEVVVAVVFIE